LYYNTHKADYSPQTQPNWLFVKHPKAKLKSTNQNEEFSTTNEKSKRRTRDRMIKRLKEVMTFDKSYCYYYPPKTHIVQNLIIAELPTSKNAYGQLF